MHYCLSFSVSLNGFNLNAHQMENLLHVDGAAIKWNFMQSFKKKGANFLVKMIKWSQIREPSFLIPNEIRE